MASTGDAAVTGSAGEQTTTRVGTAEAGQGGAGRPETGSSDRRAGIRWAISIGCRPGLWKRGLVLAALALLLGLVMLLHARIPNRIGNLGSLVETFLPWFGVFIPVLLAGALWRRSASAVAALLLPLTVWPTLFGGLLGDKSQPGGDLTVVGHNVSAGNADPAGTARALIASGADVVALEELAQNDARPLVDPTELRARQATVTFEKVLGQAYPYHTVQGNVGLWSRLPLSDTRPLDIGGDPAMHKIRALRTTVATDRGPLAVYVAHLGSVRVMPRRGFWTSERNAGAHALAEAVAAERNQRIVLLGDLNGTMDDRAFDGITARLRSAQDAAGDGFGFTWPAKFPIVRVDHILVRGVRPESAWSLSATGSDHLPVAARISW